MFTEVQLYVNKPSMAGGGGYTSNGSMNVSLEIHTKFFSGLFYTCRSVVFVCNSISS